MAPRTAKAKKATEVSEAPKKGRGKAKNVEEVQPDIEEQEIVEKEPAPAVEKKKRGKKAAGDTNGMQENGQVEESAPPAKKGRKKNAEEPAPEEKDEEKPESNVDNSGEEDAAVADNQGEKNGEFQEEQNAPSGRGRKKQAKKEPAPKPEAKTGRGRKAKQDTELETEEPAEVDEKSKPAARGRGRKAQPKLEQEPENGKEEEAKPESAPTKGRKKAQPKQAKEKSPEAEEPEAEDDASQENEEEAPKKKETKGKKNVGKKVLIKEDEEQNDEEEEEAPTKKRKVIKKEEKGKGDSKDEDGVEEEVPEAKPKGRGRGKKAVVADPTEAGDDTPDAAEATTKRRRKVADDKAPVEEKKKPPPKNKSITRYDEIDFSNTAKSPDGKDWNFKIASWNVDGIRAWMNKGGLDYINYEKPDIFCLQETKCAKDKLPEELVKVPGYHAYWECSEKDGYAGVAIYTSQLAMHVQYGLGHPELDNEGRIITAEYEQFYLICTYVPNAGKKLVTLPKRLQWNEEFRKFVKELDKKKPVIICGDMNVAHNEIDLTNPKTNKKNAGFTEEERAGMTELLGDGFVDTFRQLYPLKTGAYTFWTYMMNSRAKNVGWRLDYFIVSERLLPALCDNVIRDLVFGSDHCPIALFLHLKGADKPKESL